MFFFRQVSFNYSVLHTWCRSKRYLHGSGDEGTECHGCADAREGVGRPEVAVSWDRAVGLCKADVACALMQRGLNLELCCDPMSSQKCVVESVLSAPSGCLVYLRSGNWPEASSRLCRIFARVSFNLTPYQEKQ